MQSQNIFTDQHRNRGKLGSVPLHVPCKPATRDLPSSPHMPLSRLPNNYENITTTPPQPSLSANTENRGKTGRAERRTSKLRCVVFFTFEQQRPGIQENSGSRFTATTDSPKRAGINTETRSLCSLGPWLLISNSKPTIKTETHAQ